MPHPEPKATIILLHPYGMNKYAMIWWGFALGEAGYSTVLVDLRGHGMSSGEWTTYGILESRDVEQVIDYLRGRKLAAGPLAILGDSLGAAVAVDVAARDKHIRAVVALHPFARADQIIERFGHLAHPFLSWLLASSFEAGKQKAGQLAGVDLASAAPIEAVKNVAATIPFLYGNKDRLTPPAMAHAFENAAPDGKLIMLKGYNHVTLSASPAPIKRALRWLAPRLGGKATAFPKTHLAIDSSHTSVKTNPNTDFGFDMCFH